MERLWCVEKYDAYDAYDAHMMRWKVKWSATGFFLLHNMVEEQIPLKVTIIGNKQEMSQQATEEVQLIMFFA